MIERLLRDTMGWDAEVLGRDRLHNDIQRRMHRAGITDEAEYLELLTRSSDEFDALIEDLVVPETWFVRGNAAFTYLQRLASDQWRHWHSSGRMLRILSAPCSSGEEPYSIAATLLGAGLPADSFIIEALDISASAIARAETGIYSDYSFRGVDADFKSRFFTSHGRKWRIRPELQARVQFRRANLLDSAALTMDAVYDCIFCRNLLIYLAAEPRQRLVCSLSARLTPAGTLFLGHAEPMVLAGSEFVAVGGPGSFAFCRSIAAPSPAAASAHHRRPPAAATAVPRPYPAVPATEQSLPGSAGSTGSSPGSGSPGRRRTTAATAAAPAARTTSTAAEATTAELLVAARQAADRGDSNTAERCCQDYLNTNALDPDAHCLLALLKAAINDFAAAEQALRRCLYLCPDHTEALNHLALLYERRGDTAGAKRMRGHAAKAAAATATQHSKPSPCL